MGARSTGGEQTVLPGSPVLRYTAAVGIAAVGAGIRMAAAPVLGDRAPFTLFYPCVLIAAWYFGTGPAAVAVAASVVFSMFFLFPAGGLGAVPAGEWVSLGLFAGVSAFLIGMVDLVRRSRAEGMAAQRASEGSAEAHRLLAAIVDSTDDAIVGKDLTGRILTWNRSAERIFGYSAEEAIGRSIAMLMPPEGADDFFSIIGRIREGRKVDHYETVRRRKDGTIIEVSLTVSPVRDEKGNVIGASKIARDITAVRAAERERQRIRDLYLGILGHDLRNPLNTIAASLYTLENKVPPELRHIFPRLSRSAERMARMIDQLLDFTRARLGEGLSLEARPGNLRNICAALVEELEPQYPGRIRFRADGDLESEWDADRVAQALSNLVVNALDYGAPEHAVDVVLERQGGNARIEVTNQGSPIPEHLRPTIFEPFRRGTGDEQRARRGLGLGLFITREIVRAHGGTIELLSEGGRTTFVLRLPLAAVPETAV